MIFDTIPTLAHLLVLVLIVCGAVASSASSSSLVLPSSCCCVLAHVLTGYVTQQISLASNQWNQLMINLN